MRVSKTQLANGIADFVENEVIPSIEDKPTQILMTIAVRSVRANPKILDSILDKPMVKAILDKNKEGYEISTLFASMEDGIKQYGSFPVVIPPIPVISPVEKTLSFSESDVSELRRRIERSATNA